MQPPAWNHQNQAKKQQQKQIQKKQQQIKHQNQGHRQQNQKQNLKPNNHPKLNQKQNQQNLQTKQQPKHRHHPQLNQKNLNQKQLTPQKPKQDEVYDDNDEEDDDDDENEEVEEVQKNGKKIPLSNNNNNVNENDNEDDDEEYNDDYYDDYVDSLNNTRRAEIELVFFNRCAKVGSQSMLELIDRLAKRLKYTHSKNVPKPKQQIYLKPAAQKELLKEIVAKPLPGVYSEHINYINFTQFNMPRPIYINLVRDPLERIRSWFYYIRAEWYYIDMRRSLGDKAAPMPPKEFMEMDFNTCVKTGNRYCQYTQMDYTDGDYRRQTMFFCGQNRKFCMPFNSKAAMQKAKRTVEEDYAVVGTWEETNVTLAVLEHYIPRYFTDATKVYYEHKARLGSVNKNNVTRPMTEETRMILRQNFTHEIEFYEFCKQRLFLQYAAINGNNENDDDSEDDYGNENDDDDSEEEE